MATQQRGEFWWYRFRFAGERIDEPPDRDLNGYRTQPRRGGSSRAVFVLIQSAQRTCKMPHSISG